MPNMRGAVFWPNPNKDLLCSSIQACERIVGYLRCLVGQPCLLVIAFHRLFGDQIRLEILNQR